MHSARLSPDSAALYAPLLQVVLRLPLLRRVLVLLPLLRHVLVLLLRRGAL